MNLIKNIFHKLEDPSVPFMGPYIKLLKASGLFVPKGGIKRYMSISIDALYFILSVAQVIDLWNVRSNKILLLNNLKVTVVASTTILKACTFFIWQEKWKDMVNYVNKTDKQQNKSNDNENQKIIRESTKFSRIISYLYRLAILIGTGSIILGPVLKFALFPRYRENARNGKEEYMPVFGAWVPWDDSTLSGYIVISFLNSLCVMRAFIWIISFDINALAIMTFLKRELELLRLDSSKIFGSVDSPVEQDEEISKRIMECHVRHTKMIKCAKLLNSCLAPIMTYYVITCSIMLCANSYYITIEKSPMQRILTLQLLASAVLQLFLYCWHSNTILYISEKLYLGPYESMWWNHKSHRKSILLLMIQFSRNIVFTAPPFGNIDLSSFINILKGSYSYYTFLTQSNNED